MHGWKIVLKKNNCSYFLFAWLTAYFVRCGSSCIYSALQCFQKCWITCMRWKLVHRDSLTLVNSGSGAVVNYLPFKKWAGIRGRRSWTSEDGVTVVVNNWGCLWFVRRGLSSLQTLNKHFQQFVLNETWLILRWFPTSRQSEESVPK